MYFEQHVELLMPYHDDVCQSPVENGFVDVVVQVEFFYDGVRRPGRLCCRISS